MAITSKSYSAVHQASDESKAEDYTNTAERRWLLTLKAAQAMRLLTPFKGKRGKKNPFGADFQAQTMRMEHEFMRRHGTSRYKPVSDHRPILRTRYKAAGGFGGAHKRVSGTVARPR